MFLNLVDFKFGDSVPQPMSWDRRVYGLLFGIFSRPPKTTKFKTPPNFPSKSLMNNSLAHQVSIEPIMSEKLCNIYLQWELLFITFQ